MPDEAQQSTQRRTAMQVAEAAQALAESARTEADNAVGLIEGLSEKITELDTRSRDLGAAATTAATDVDLPTRDQVDGRIAEALAPVTQALEAHRQQIDAGLKMAAPRTMLDSLKEEIGGFVGAVNRKMDDLRTRVAELQGWQENVSARLSQDLDSAQVPSRQEVDGLLARLEDVESRPVGGGENVGLTWDAIAERVTNQAKIEVQKHLALIAPGGAPGSPVKPRGVQAKVLELMRTVDSIGKDRQAEKSAGGYRFRGIDEAMDAVGHAMRQIGLIGSPEVRSVEYDTNYSNNSAGRSILWTTARVVGAYVFTDPADGSTHRIELVGEGRDNSDKATSKASSMALKYGLLHGLMIPVNGMPDGDAENPEVSREREDPATAQAKPTPPPAGRATPPANAPAAAQATPQERAQRAVAAFQGLGQLQDGQERYNRFVAMSNHARKERLIDIEVEWKGQRAPLHYFMSAVELLLWPTPADEPPPWDGH